MPATNTTPFVKPGKELFYWAATKLLGVVAELVGVCVFWPNTQGRASLPCGYSDARF